MAKFKYHISYIIVWMLLLPLCGYSIPSDNNKYSPRVQIEGKVGNRRSIVRPSTLIPIYQRRDSMIHLSLIGMSDTRSALEANMGIGVRHLIHNNIFGLYGFYDIRRSSRNNTIHQATIGAEWFKKFFEFRFNLYLPQKRTFSVSEVKNVLSKYIKSGSTVDIELKTSKKVEQALPGFDIDIGTQLPALPELTVRAAYYRFASSDKHIETRNGFRGVLGYKVYEFFQIDGEISYDNQRKLVYFGGITVGYNFDKTNKKHLSLTRLEKKMNMLPIRDVDAVTAVGDEPIDSINITVNGAKNRKTVIACADVTNKRLTAYTDSGVTYADNFGDEEMVALIKKSQDENINLVIVLNNMNTKQGDHVFYISQLSKLEDTANVVVRINGVTVDNNRVTENDVKMTNAFVKFYGGINLLDTNRKLKNKLKEQEEKLQQHNQDNSNLKDQLERKEKEYNDRKQNWIDNMKNLQDQQNSYKDELRDEKENIGGLEDEIEKLKQRIRELNKEKESMNKTHTRHRNMSSADISHVVEKLHTLRKTQCKEEKAANVVKKNMQKQILELEQQTRELESNLLNAQYQLDSKEKYLNEQEQQRNEALLEMQEHLQNNSSKMSEKMQQQVSEMIMESTALKSDLSKTQETLNQKQQKISELENNLQKNKVSKNKMQSNMQNDINSLAATAKKLNEKLLNTNDRLSQQDSAFKEQMKLQQQKFDQQKISNENAKNLQKQQFEQQQESYENTMRLQQQKFNQQKSSDDETIRIQQQQIEQQRNAQIKKQKEFVQMQNNNKMLAQQNGLASSRINSLESSLIKKDDNIQSLRRTHILTSDSVIKTTEFLDEALREIVELKSERTYLAKLALQAQQNTKKKSNFAFFKKSQI